MTYQDRYYGLIHLNEFILELAGTSRVQRLKGVSLGVLPASCVSFDIPSRYEHCLGVAYLAYLLYKSNSHLGNRIKTLIAAALLHDAGNPGTSHAAEYFLKRESGFDGESFLRIALEGSDTARVLESHGIDIGEVIELVVGGMPPFSDVLHGSIDLDNIDNVGRYLHAATSQVLFSGPALAISFVCRDDSWSLIDRSWDEAQYWKRARLKTYSHIYAHQNLAPAAMVWHGIDLASRGRLLGPEFFRLDDEQTLDRISEMSRDAAYVVDLARNKQHYDLVFDIETDQPSRELVDLCHRPDRRECIERAVRDEVRLPDVAFCCYAGEGKDVRRIDLPFIGDDGVPTWDVNEVRPIYRLKAYLDPACTSKRQAVERCMNRLYGSLA